RRSDRRGLEDAGDEQRGPAGGGRRRGRRCPWGRQGRGVKRDWGQRHDRLGDLTRHGRSAALISALAVAILLVATAAAIVETQHLRDQGPVVSSTKLKTRRDGGYRICFSLTRNDIVQVAVVNAADQQVRVISSEVPLMGSDSAPDK